MSLSGLTYPFSFRRTNAGPLDASLVFENYTDARTYALNDNPADDYCPYGGQIIGTEDGHSYILVKETAASKFDLTSFSATSHDHYRLQELANINLPNTWAETQTFASSVHSEGYQYGETLASGTGWNIDKSGAARLDSLSIRNFLEVPELRYNRVTVESGTTWNAPGAGVIKKIVTGTTVFDLKLEEGEVGSFVEGDICMGIWHFTGDKKNLNASADAEDKDTSGLTVAGFCRVEFVVDKVEDYTEDGVTYTNGRVTIKEYRNANATVQPQMTIVAYGNKAVYQEGDELPSDTEVGDQKFPNRTRSWYATKKFQRYIYNMDGSTNCILRDKYGAYVKYSELTAAQLAKKKDDGKTPYYGKTNYEGTDYASFDYKQSIWDISFPWNVAMHLGDTKNMSVTEKDGNVVNMGDYSAFLSNVYFYGHQQKIAINQIEDADRLFKTNFIVDLTSQTNVIHVNVGEDAQGKRTYTPELINETGSPVAYTAITLRAGTQMWTLPEDWTYWDPEDSTVPYNKSRLKEGKFTFTVNPVNCEIADIVDTSIYVTGLKDNAYTANECYVTISVEPYDADIVLVKDFNVRLVYNGLDGKNATGHLADLTNQMSAIPCDKNYTPVDAKTLETTATLTYATSKVNSTIECKTNLEGKGLKVYEVRGGTEYELALNTATTNALTEHLLHIKTIADGDSYKTIPSSLDIEFELAGCQTEGVEWQGTKSVTFTAIAVTPGADGKTPVVYELRPSLDSIIFSRKEDGTLTPDKRALTVQLSYMKGEEQQLLNVPDGYSVRYSQSAQIDTTAQGSALPAAGIDIANTESGNVYLSLFRDTTLIDRETIPILKDGTDGEDGDDAVRYDLNLSALSIYKNNKGAVISPSGNLTWNVTKTVGGTTINATETDVMLWRDGGKVDLSGSIAKADLSSLTSSTFELRSAAKTGSTPAKGDIIYTTATIGTLKDGDDAAGYTADLTNEMSGLPCDNNHKLDSNPNISTDVTMRYGGTDLASTLKYIPEDAVLAQYGLVLTPSKSSNTHTLTLKGTKDNCTTAIPTPLELTITLTCTQEGEHKDKTAKSTFTIMPVLPGADGESPTIYQLLPSHSEIKKSKSNTLSTNTLTVGITKTKSGVTSDASSEDGHPTIYYNIDDVLDGGSLKWTSIDPNAEITIPSTFAKHVRLELRNDSTVIDKETIPLIVDGINGTPGQSVYTSTLFIRSASAPSLPTGGSFAWPSPLTAAEVNALYDADKEAYRSAWPSGSTKDWSDGIPADDGSPLYMTSRIFTSDGKTPQQSAWQGPTLAADSDFFDVCYHGEFAAGTTPNTDGIKNHGTQTDATDGGWHNTPLSTDIYMATSKKANGVWSAWALAKIAGEDGKDAVRYDLGLSALSIYKNNKGSVVSPSGNLTWNVTKTVGGTTNNATETDVMLWRDGNKVDLAGSIAKADLSSLTSSTFELRSAKTEGSPAQPAKGDIIYTTATIGTLKDGDDAAGYTADLTNEMSGLPCDNNHKLDSNSNISTDVTMRYGGTDLASTLKYIPEDAVLAKYGLVLTPTVSDNTHTLTLTGTKDNCTTAIPTPLELTITLTCTQEGEHKNKTAKSTFTIMPVLPGADGESPVIYQLLPSHSEIKKNKSNTLSTNTLTVGITKTKSGVTSDASSEDGHPTIYYNIDDVLEDGSLKWTSIDPNAEIPIPSTFAKHVRLELRNSSTVIDKETIPLIVDGTDGQAVFTSTVFLRSASVPSKPTGGEYTSPVPSGWSDGIPADDGNPLYMSQRVFTSDGKTPQQSAWSEPTLASDTDYLDVCYSSNKTQPSTDEINNNNTTQNTSNWHNTATTDDIWMATRTKKNDGTWNAWVVTKIKGEDGANATRYDLGLNTQLVHLSEKGDVISPTDGLTWNVTKTEGNKAPATPGADMKLWVRYSGTGSWTIADYTKTIVKATLKTYTSIELKLCSYNSTAANKDSVPGSTIYASGTVSYVSDGSSSTGYICDNNNEMSGVAVDHSNYPSKAATTECTVSLKYGNNTNIKTKITNITDTSAYGITVVETEKKAVGTVEDVEHTLTFSIPKHVEGDGHSALPNPLDIFITLTSVEATGEHTAAYGKTSITLMPVEPGANGVSPTIYELVPSADSIVIPRDGTDPTKHSTASQTLTVQIKKCVESTQQVYDYNNDAVKDIITTTTSAGKTYVSTIRYSTTGVVGSASAGSAYPAAGISVSSSVTKVYLSLFDKNGKLLDRETVPVIKDGTQGEPGKNIASVTNYYKWSDSGINSGSDNWRQNQVPTHEAGKDYLWNYEVNMDGDGNIISSSDDTCIGYFPRGIKETKEYYLAYASQPTAPTLSNSNKTITLGDWKEDSKDFTLNATTPYLWNVEVIKYSDDTYYVSTPHKAYNYSSIVIEAQGTANYNTNNPDPSIKINGTSVSLTGEGVSYKDEAGDVNHRQRGHFVCVLDPTTYAVKSRTWYDCYNNKSSGTESTDIEAAGDAIVIMVTKDASTMDDTLRTTLKKYGGSSDVPNWNCARRAHVFIGKRGLVEGQAIELYSSAPQTPDSYNEAILTAMFTGQWNGTQGPQGAQGPGGDDGKSAYEIAQDNGFTGTEAQWLASLKGDPGIGQNGAILRARGIFSADNTYWNTNDWVDWVKADGSTNKWRVADGIYKIRYSGNITYYTPVVEDASTGSRSAGTETSVSGIYKPDNSAGEYIQPAGKPALWKKFSEGGDTAFHLMLADSANIDNANMGEAFIGKTSGGVTTDANGNILVDGTANGWLINGGQIRHTQSGLTLTSDGKLYDPDGLHLKVGTSVRNVLLDDVIGKFSSKFWINILGINNACNTKGSVNYGASITYNNKTYQSPWGNKIYQMLLKSWDSASNNYCHACYNSGAYAQYMYKLQPNKVYYLSVWTQVVDANNYLDNSVAEIGIWKTNTSSTQDKILLRTRTGSAVSNSGTNSGASYTYQYLGITDTTKDSNSQTISQVSMSLKITSSTAVYMTWIPRTDIVKTYNSGSAAIFYYGAKLETDVSTPTNIGKECFSLLDTGIDIANRKITLTADQLECRNQSDEKTMWLDELGNLVTAGIQSQMIQKIKDDDTFLNMFIPSLAEPGRIDSQTTYKQSNFKVGSLTTTAVSPLTYNLNSFPGGGSTGNVLMYASLDMRSACGEIQISHLPSKVTKYEDVNATTSSYLLSILLPYYKLEYTSKNVFEAQLQRTPCRMNGHSVDYITMDELSSLVGRRMTIVNHLSSVIYINDVEGNHYTLLPDDFATFEFVHESDGPYTILATQLPNSEVQRTVRLPYMYWKLIEDWSGFELSKGTTYNNLVGTNYHV